jgi:hypothetical protein
MGSEIRARRIPIPRSHSRKVRYTNGNGKAQPEPQVSDLEATPTLAARALTVSTKGV